MLLSEGNDCIYIEELYGFNNQGDIKGAGTQLLKFASEKSIEKGYKGKLQLKMSGSFPFYYKNNFRITKNTADSNIKNAAIDYITRNGESINKLWLPYWSTPIVELDETSASHMLRGIRDINNSKSKVLYSKQLPIKNRLRNADIDFCDLGSDFVIQIIDKDKSTNSCLAYIEGKIKNKNLITNGAIKSNWCYDQEPRIIKELKEAYKIAQEYFTT